MLVLVEQVLPDSKAGGFGLTRLWANLEWSSKDNPGPWDCGSTGRGLTMFSQSTTMSWCTRMTRLNLACVVFDILRTHPMVILGEILQLNLFFIHPNDFLHELHGRAEPSAPPDAPPVRVGSGCGMRG
jgi:hypothetical protein